MSEEGPKVIELRSRKPYEAPKEVLDVDGNTPEGVDLETITSLEYILSEAKQGRLHGFAFVTFSKTDNWFRPFIVTPTSEKTLDHLFKLEAGLKVLSQFMEDFQMTEACADDEDSFELEPDDGDDK